MKKIYLIPNMITAFGLACGLFIIFRVSLLNTPFIPYEMLMSASLLFLLAAFADLLDGMVARILRAENEFGAFFDSLADAISFGVAPSVLLLKTFALEHTSTLAFFAILGAMLYSICGVLRLVRFNVKAGEVKGDSAAQLQHKRLFTGLPIPAGAAVVISTTLFLHSPFIPYVKMSAACRTIVLSLIMLLVGYLMISRWQFPSLKTLNVRVSAYHLVFLSVILAICLLYGILYYFPLIFFLLSMAYVVTGSIMNICHLCKRP